MCKQCSKNSEHKHSKEILSLPSILQFCVERFDEDGKKLNFGMRLPLVLDMTEFVITDKQETKYTLKAIIEHTGKSIQ